MVVTTIVSSVIVLGALVASLFSHFWWFAVPVTSVLLVSGPCGMPRGYEIKHDAIVVKRVVRPARSGRKDLTGARLLPGFKMGTRLYGNGGFFGYTGRYRSADVGGRYSAYVTDPDNAVLLEFGERKVVVSPEHPERFVKALGF